MSKDETVVEVTRLGDKYLFECVKDGKRISVVDTDYHRGAETIEKEVSKDE